ncbi:MAG: hypothetical protein JWO62_2591 [Acidimicrobiaceae bacterium]|jgi:hypothetical protein|nr:hypothetical protein [Acidimicrobiaceae bacterium]
MTDTRPSSDKTWLYRFSRPGGVEIGTHELNSDDAAALYARQLPQAGETPIVIERHDLVDWEYVTEIDERP